jgi:hypothetical protein
MISPQALEQAVRWRHEEFLAEAARERRARAARPRTPSLRHWLASVLYGLAAQLSAGVADAMADARSSGAGFRIVVNCNGVEYWWPAAARM